MFEEFKLIVSPINRKRLLGVGKWEDNHNMIEILSHNEYKLKNRVVKIHRLTQVTELVIKLATDTLETIINLHDHVYLAWQSSHKIVREQILSILNIPTTYLIFKILNEFNEKIEYIYKKSKLQHCPSPISEYVILTADIHCFSTSYILANNSEQIRSSNNLESGLLPKRLFSEKEFNNIFREIKYNQSEYNCLHFNDEFMTNHSTTLQNNSLPCNILQNFLNNDETQKLHKKKELLRDDYKESFGLIKSSEPDDINESSTAKHMLTAKYNDDFEENYMYDDYNLSTKYSLIEHPSENRSKITYNKLINFFSPWNVFSNSDKYVADAYSNNELLSIATLLINTTDSELKLIDRKRYVSPKL